MVTLRIRDLSLTFALVMLASICNEVYCDDFRVTAPGIWKRDVGIPLDHGQIYVNKDSKDRQIIVLRKIFSSGIRVSTLDSLMTKRSEDVTNAREKLLREFGIGRYLILDVTRKLVKDFKNGDRLVYTILSRFDGFWATDVQMVERQYISDQVIFQVAYFEESPAIKDLARVNRLLDDFRPIFHPTRAPAGTFDVADPVPGKIKSCEPNCGVQREAPTGLAGIGQVPGDCAKNVISGLNSSVGALSSLADSTNALARQGKGYKLFYDQEKGAMYKVDSATLDRANRDLKTIPELAENGTVKPMSSASIQAERETAMSALVAEVKKIPVAQYPERVLSGLWHIVTPYLRGLNSNSAHDKLTTLCELATNFIPAPVMIKLASGLKLTAAEAEPIAKAFVAKSSAEIVEDSKSGLRNSETVTYSNGTQVTPQYYLRDDNDKLGALRVTQPDGSEIWFERTNRELSSYSMPDDLKTSLLQEYQGKKVADLGAGGGNAVEDLRAAGVDAQGHDLFLTPDQKSKGYFSQGDLRSTPYSSNEFDLTMTNMTFFTYVPARAGENGFNEGLKVVSEMHRITKPGGKIVIGGTNLRNIRDILAKFPDLRVLQNGQNYVVLLRAQ